MSFSRERQEIYLIRKDSHNLQTLKVVERILGYKKTDFLFIDGDHTYEGVKKGGIVAFHDIVPGTYERVGGVPEFWGEIKHNYKYVELVIDWNQGVYGIVVIYV